MAEIKSTMDIIMEKLKNMEISEQEKETIIEKEAKETAKKMMVRYMENPSVEYVLGELESMDEKKKRKTTDALIHECLDMITPYSKGNETIFNLLSFLIKKDISPLKKRVSYAEQELNKERKRHERVLLERLRKRGVYGSAVIPNVEADAEWEKKVKEIKNRLYSDMNYYIIAK